MIRTRFAPSPTGDLHVGGARTALFAYLFARHHGGEFLLRIEDTDQARSTDAFKDVILEGMAWLGLEHDGEVVHQMQRLSAYREALEQLLDEKKAYVCTCSKERLETLKAEQKAQGLIPRYDGVCRDKQLSFEKGSVVRYAMPQAGEASFDDAVYGTVTVPYAQLDDWVMWRSDDTPTYNFTVVIDDAEMHITHVIRGEDHLSNTPKQLALYAALQKPVPIFAHVPMILGTDGKRLSKRHGATSVLAYRDAGYLPEALLNGLVRLGWSHGDMEIFSKEEMVKLFSLEHLQRSAARFQTEKLDWLNQQYLKEVSAERGVSLLEEHLEAQGARLEKGPECQAVWALQHTRSTTLRAMAEESLFFYQAPATYDIQFCNEVMTPHVQAALQDLQARWHAMDNWEEAALKASLKTTLKTHGLKMPQLARPVRLALTGGLSSPAVTAVLVLLGKKDVLSRLEAFFAFLLKSA